MRAVNLNQHATDTDCARDRAQVGQPQQGTPGRTTLGAARNRAGRARPFSPPPYAGLASCPPQRSWAVMVSGERRHAVGAGHDWSARERLVSLLVCGARNSELLLSRWRETEWPFLVRPTGSSPIPRRLRTDHTRIGKAPRGARCRMDGHSRGRAPATGARCRAVSAASSRGKGCRMHMAWRHGVSAFREWWTKRSRWSGGRPCRGKRRPGRAGALPRLLCTHSSPNQSPWPPQGQRRARYTGSLPVRAGTGRAWRSLTIRSLLCGAILGAESS